MIIVQKPTLQIACEPVSLLVKRQVDQMTELWWSTPNTHPDTGPLISSRQQQENEKQLARLLDGLQYALKRAPASAAARDELRQTIMDESFGALKRLLGFEERQLDVIRRYGLIDMVEQFADQARRYDPAISAEDIYQASRNVSSMNLMQLLLGLPVALTPAVFAYSMLYPYTDNYLDDPAIPFETKAGFNQRFWNRLAGQPSAPATAQEARIWDLVEMVERQYARSFYPQVYESLLAIHAAQFRSLCQLRLGASPYEVDVLRISFEKGGASVLADGYLVAGNLREEQAAFMFRYGAFTQLMDDLEDVEPDRKAGAMTIFSQTAGHFALDGLTNRLIHLGNSVFQLAETFPTADAVPLQAMILRAIPLLLSLSAANFPQYYSRDYLQTLERCMPFRFAFLRQQRKKLERNRISLIRVIEAGK